MVEHAQNSFEKTVEIDGQLKVEAQLLPEQVDFMKKDIALGKLTLSDEGKIEGIPPEGDIDQAFADSWQKRPGVIDAQMTEGALVVVYNANVQVPEGCRDLRESARSGEYDPESRICYVDISNSWDFLEDRYRPSWIRGAVRHELRHHLVAAADEAYSEKCSVKGRRCVDLEDIELNHPEDARQLSYLDELHSQYFDVIDGEVEGHGCFRNLDSEIYSVVASGGHEKVATADEKAQLAVRELFFLLQGTILLKRMSDQSDLGANASDIAGAVGATLGTERSVIAARNRVSAIWLTAMSNESVKRQFQQFLRSYQPSIADNTPVLSDEMLVVCGIKPE